MFKGLSVKATEIINERSKIYQEYKKMHDGEDDQFAIDCCNLKIEQDTKETKALKDLWTEYQTMLENISKYRENAQEYDELDTLFAYVSFRTPELREEFEKKIEDINTCYSCKY